ncbi:unnamed protein product [Spirodela intermedia]|uniref:Leucine-rich repeat-containing N-terminal plant-type domain-containing protein n=1 Tax=Spirodela intermedia TaxID=51605 RepID=A0A7I8L888_SPIIN|nr:unnamed protein product [Spirodela intermedia]
MGKWQLNGLSLLVGWVVWCCVGWPSGVQGCLKQEREALLRLRDGLYSPGPVNSSEWPSWVGQDCCLWDGVSCQSDPPRRVIGVSLSNRRRDGLGGWAVDGSLFVPLEKLQSLHMKGNHISGWSRPEGMSGLRDIQSVDLSENELTDEGVSWIFRLPSVGEVQLSFNKLRSSSLIKGFCTMKSLTSLHLEVNKIEGTIDPCIAAMPAMEEIYLQSNHLTGEIPSFQNASSIKVISLGGNRLAGVFFFSSIAGLRNLTGVDLSANPGLEVETESPPWVPSFQLNGLLLGGCALNRRSGRVLPTFLSTQKNLQVLDLSRTSIRGELPAWLFDNAGEYLYLGGNKFTGPIPKLAGGTERRLSLLDLSENSIRGPLPENMSSLLPQLYHVNFSRNAFRGSMDSFAQLRYVGVLDVSYNQLAGEIPAGLTANGSRIRHLNLGHNKLGGSILPRGSSMRNLKYLILEDNLLTGGISPELSGSPELIILNLRRNQLSGTIPKESFALSQPPVVLLGENKFRGRIPDVFCRMEGLRILDLSANSLSGAVPGCLSHVASWRNASKALLDQNYYFSERVAVEFRTKGKLRVFENDDLSWFTGVDLSMNQLAGAIPAEIGTLAALRSLNISRNHINGEIPVSFQGLEMIESLDLSHNQLTGRIPHQMARLRHLSVFCVAFNKLRGDIPLRSRFSSAIGRGCF